MHGRILGGPGFKPQKLIRPCYKSLKMHKIRPKSLESPQIQPPNMFLATPVASMFNLQLGEFNIQSSCTGVVV